MNGVTPKKWQESNWRYYDISIYYKQCNYTMYINMYIYNPI